MKRCLLLCYVMLFAITISADKTVQRSLTINVGETVVETYEGGSGGTITVFNKDIVSCAFGDWHQLVFKGLKSGYTSVQISVPGYKYIYSVNVVEVKSITIPDNISLLLGESYTFSPIISDVGATTSLTWSCNNQSVVSLDNTGTVTGLMVGSAIIICTASNGVSAQCHITVNPIMVNNITLDTDQAEMTIGEKLQLLPTVTPDNATNKNVIWSSTNDNVAIVNENGLVTAVGSGACQIKATAEDGSGKTASCVVTVAKNNKLSISDMAQCNGGRGVMNVALTDEETILGFQFDLQLPDGVTVATDESNALMASLTGNASSTHNFSSSKVADGLYRFVVTPKGTTPLSSATNDGMSITIDVADDVAVGAYTMTIKDVEMTVLRGSDYVDVHPKDNTATLTISEAVAGDVNGDTRISVTDVISIVAYIMENTPSKFIMKAADVNDDGNITITDAVLVIDIILNDKNQAPRKITPIVEPQ